MVKETNKKNIIAKIGKASKMTLGYPQRMGTEQVRPNDIPTWWPH